MGLTAPKFRLSADSQDVTDAIASRLISLRVTDEVGSQSDMLEVTLADNDPASPIIMPRTGAELEVWLGYDSAVGRMGLFVCDEIEMSGPPGLMVIRARGAVWDGTKTGKSDLQTQKTRAWPDKTTIGDMVAKIAKEHGLTPSVAASLKSVQLPHMSQTSESDVSFLVRILKNYDAVVKPAGGKLVIVKLGESKTTSGEPIPAVVIKATDSTSWHMSIARHEKPGTVVAFYHPFAKAHRIEVQVGDGDPVKQLRHHYPTEAAAKAAAQAALDKRKRGERKLSVTLPGATNLIAEAKMTATGFRPEIDGEWLIVRAEHSFEPTSGYVCHIEAEKTTDDPDDADSDQSAVVATPQPAGGAPVQVAQPAPKPDPAKLAAMKAEYAQVESAWGATIQQRNVLNQQASALISAGDSAGAQAKLAEAKAIGDAAREKYSAKYDQLKAQIEAYK